MIGFFDLPEEMRMCVINAADAKTRAALEQCCSTCQEEVQKSPLYIDNIEVFSLPNRAGLVLFVGHQRDRQDYFLSFEPVRQSTINVVRFRSDGLVLSTKPVNSVQPIFEFSLDFFKNFMVSYGRGIRKLAIFGARLEWNWEELRPFRRLEVLEARDHATAAHLLPKTNGFLLHLATDLTDVEGDSDQLAHFAQIFNVRGTLDLRRTILNNAQLLQLQAKTIILPTGFITPEGIIDFINQWRRGERNGHNSLALIWWNWNVFDARTVFFALVRGYIPENHPPFRLHQHPPHQGEAELNMSFEDERVIFTFATV